MGSGALSYSNLDPEAPRCRCGMPLRRSSASGSQQAAHKGRARCGRPEERDRGADDLRVCTWSWRGKDQSLLFECKAHVDFHMTC